MKIADVIKFEGDPDQLVWKYPYEDFNTLSQLIVDETHEALLVINGNAADLFGPGRRTLNTNNIPILSRIIEIPTDGVSPFPCKVFFVNKVHQMDILWGTQSPIPLEDPLYDIFMHVMLHGSISISISDTRKFLLKMVGFRKEFDAKELVSKFRGIISSQVKDSISKIMIDGKLSYFMISSELLSISDILRERLDSIFDEYGVHIEFFNIESIEVPDKDYEEISQAKKLRTSRMIQGYTWKDERQMMIAEKFAANEGTMGQIGGIIGGTAGGLVMGNTISEIARNALNGQGIVPLNEIVEEQNDKEDNKNQNNKTIKFCVECGSKIPVGAKFCPECGKKVENSNVCPNCNAPIKEGMKFCPECGNKL